MIISKRLWASGLAIVFLIAHLILLPSTLEDIDSLNFALGIHDFDPTQHQPHPPGYPIFIAMAKVARALVPSDARALALLGALLGALAVFPLLRIYEDLESLQGRPASTLVPALATLLTVASPLYWFNAGRPMSDVPGLAVTLAAQSALVSAFVRQRLNPARTPEALASSGRMIVLGAFLSALAIGTRSQAMALTLPLFVVVLVQRAGRGAAGALLGSGMAFTIGILIWAIPLVVASGGVVAFRTVLSAQGGEDLAGVDMLYLNPSVRRLAFNLLETFIEPWASPVLGSIIVVFAAMGAIALVRRVPRAVLLLGALVGPYCVVHLLLQETLTTRYALPLIPAITYLVIKGIEWMGAIRPRGGVDDADFGRPVYASAIAAILVVWSLLLTMPAVRIYARAGSPAFAALADLHQRLQAEPGAAVAMHQAFARPVRTQDFGKAKVLRAPPMREWLELAAYWKEGNTAPVWFLADPPRTDLELIDPASREIVAHYAWGFPRGRFIGGSRPDAVDLIRIASPPGWYAEEGWHLTPETLNMSERLGRDRGVAYITSRPAAALMVIGGENVASGPNANASVSLEVNDHTLDRWEVPAGGTFFKRIVLDPGVLAGSSTFSRLVASYASPDGRPYRIRLTQFAVDSPEALFFVHHSGWYEIEYSQAIQRRWRWMAGRAQTFVNSGGRDITVTIAGESPQRYFDAPPRVSVRAGNQVLATAQPFEDFELTVKVPAPVLAAADGLVTIETDKTFVPHERSGSPDKRALGLRIFRFEVR